MTAPVIFLDIDGVLNSHRSCMAYKGFPSPAHPDTWGKLDGVAIGLLQRVVRKTGAVCVLSSTWRIGATEQDIRELSKYLGVPIIDVTRYAVDREVRGHQIRDWLAAHPEVTTWAILDDDSDMLPEQMGRFVKVDHYDGLSYWQHLKLIELLGGERAEP